MPWRKWGLSQTFGTKSRGKIIFSLSTVYGTRIRPAGISPIALEPSDRILEKLTKMKKREGVVCEGMQLGMSKSCTSPHQHTTET